jgi:hypothetical protein
MSWLYLPALAGGCSQADGCSAGEPFAQLNSIPTGKRCCSRAKRTACSILSRSGRTFVISTDARGVESWISSLRAIRASETAIAGEVGASRKSSDMKLCGSSPKSGHAIYCGKIQHANAKTLNGHTCECVTHSEQSVMRRNASGLEPVASGPIINAHVCSCSPAWPTPTRNMYRSGRHSSELRARRRVKGRGAPLHEEWWWRTGKPIMPADVERLMLWPPGWTGLARLATDKFQQWLRSQQDCCCIDCQT